MRLCRVCVDSRIAGGKARVLHHDMNQEGTAHPTHPGMAIVFSQIEQAGLRGEDA